VAATGWKGILCLDFFRFAQINYIFHQVNTKLESRGRKMGLIIEQVIYEGIALPPIGAENVYINVQKQYLSRYYDLPNYKIIIEKFRI
jgi:hypothetical protein